jgi:hypothetical protein
VPDLGSGRVRGYAWQTSSDDVSHESIGSFAWSPDGRWLAYQSVLEYDCDELPEMYRCTRLRVVLLRLSDGAERVIYRTPLDPGALPEAHGLDWR